MGHVGGRCGTERALVAMSDRWVSLADSWVYCPTTRDSGSTPRWWAVEPEVRPVAPGRRFEARAGECWRRSADLDTTGANLSRFGAVDQAGGRPVRPREVRELPRALRALWAAAPVSLAGVVPGPGHSGFLLDGGVEGLGLGGWVFTIG